MGGGWAELRAELTELRRREPGCLMSHPDPHVEVREGPFDVGLAPWAEAEAERLHGKYGSDIRLTVGMLDYPLPAAGSDPLRARAQGETLNPDEVAVRLDGEVVVRAGHSIAHGLLVANRTDDVLTLMTNGRVTAYVVDPTSEKVIGGHAGAQHLRLVKVEIRPGESMRVPLLIGTASFTPSLGYVVPAGSWGLVIPLTISTGEAASLRRVTPVLPLTVRD